MGRNASWGVESMYPVATELVAVSIASCEVDITPPELTKLGAEQITLEVGETFIDPGATATDDVDGDITANIQVDGTVDTSQAGVYYVSYTVSDSSGNTVATSPRKVTVIDNGPPSAPTVDESWSALIRAGELINTQYFESELNQMSMTVYQDTINHDVYLQLGKHFIGSFKNIQVYLDTDNNPATGYKAWSSTSTTAETGAEYLVQNGVLYKYTGRGNNWSWSSDSTPLPYHTESNCSGLQCSLTSYIQKMIIPASLLTSDTVGIMAFEASLDWSTHELFVRNDTYTLVE